MRCITFGLLLVLLIILMVVSPLLGGTITGLVSTALVLWWLVGFFVKCDEYNLENLTQ